jgi:16S rRNA (guanine1516-N2)-methyltransferase
MKYIVTTIKDPPTELLDTAADLATKLSIRYVPREECSIDALRSRCNVEGIIVVTRKQIELVMSAGCCFFHIGMAKLRIKNIREGKYDHMAQAMGVLPGDRILDCTLGLGTDAIVASYLAGSKGRVVGIESSPVVAEIVRRGLTAYDPEDKDIKKAMRNIEVVTGDSLAYLQTLPDQSFDIVYFDPMFRRPVQDSSGIAPLREVANPEPISTKAVHEAKRVAKKRVVLKEAARSKEFTRLGFSKISGGKYSSVMYGYNVTEEGE